MMRPVLAVTTWLIAMAIVAATQGPLTVDTLRLGEPVTVASIDSEKLKGQPARLAWSPDGAQLYLQAIDGAFGQTGAALHHYAFSAETGRRQDLPAEPEWASAYWTAKSGQGSPDGQGLKIELKSETRTEQTVSTPMGGDLARGGTSAASGTGAGDGIAAAYNRQTIPVHSMWLRGQMVGEFLNSVIVPGLTFGWGPPGTKIIAYSAHKTGRVVVMDDTGARAEIGRSREAILPAWSADATRLAWLQKDGRKRFVLQVARVSTS